MAIAHPTQRGVIVVKKDANIQMMDSSSKQSLGAAQMPANSGVTYQMKFIDGLLHVITSQLLLRFSDKLDQMTTICQLSTLFEEQQSLITSFTGNAESNVYAISAIVGGKAKTAIFNATLQVVPEMISSNLSVINENVYLSTSPMTSQKVSTVNITQRKPMHNTISQEANEIVKAMVYLAKPGILAVFTSLQKIYIMDLFSMHTLCELKTQAQVVLAAPSQNGAIYVQADGRVFNLIPEMQLLMSNIQNKLSASEQYNHFIQTNMFEGTVQFQKIYKNYLEEVFKQANWAEVAHVVADSVKFKADQDVRTQQLIDKISLSDRKAFLQYASMLAQNQGIKLNLNETLTLIKLLHQENMMAVALPKFIEGNFLEEVENNEQPGNLIIELAGTPIPKEYAALALQMFKKYGCHVRVIKFFLKNADVKTALDYVSKLQQQVAFSFVEYLFGEYPKPLEVKDKEKVGMEAVQLLQSEVVSWSEKEKLIMEMCIPLGQGQTAIQYMNGQVQQNNSQETQTLFVKTLLSASGDMAKVRGALFATLAGPMSLVNREELVKFCLQKGLHDIALFALIESKLRLEFEDLLKIESVDQFQIICEKFTFGEYSSEDLLYVARLVKENSSDATIYCVSRALMAMAQQIEWISEDIDKKLQLEIKRKLFAAEDLFEEMIRQVIVEERPLSSPLVNMNSIYELMIMTKQTTASMSEKIAKFAPENENQKFLVACVFSFVYLTSQLLQPCAKCNEQILYVMCGEQLYDHRECIKTSIDSMEQFCGKTAAVEALLQKFGFKSEARPQDKFNRYGKISHILSLVQLLLDQDDFEMLQKTVIPDVRLSLNQDQMFDILNRLSVKAEKANLAKIIDLVKELYQQNANVTIKNTLTTFKHIAEIIDEQIPDELKVDMNVIDPEVILKNAKILEAILVKQESPISSAQKIMEIVARLPSQNVDQYLVDLTFTISQIYESEVPLQQLTQLACKKQDVNFWTLILQKLPKAANLAANISGNEILSFAQATLDTTAVDYQFVKDLLRKNVEETGDKKFAQNLILQIDVKINDEETLMKDVGLYGDCVTITVANAAIEAGMFKAASSIFKHMNNHVDAVSCLLNNKLTEEAWAYAQDAQDANAWRIICNFYINAMDYQKAFNALKLTNQLLMTTDLARVVSRTQDIDLHFALSQYMIGLRMAKTDKFIDSDLATLLAACMHHGNNEDQVKRQLAALLQDAETTINPQQLGDQCFMKEMFKPARLFYLSAQNFRALNSVCLKVSDFHGCLQACTKLNERESWEEVRNELLRLVTISEEFDNTKMLYLYVAQLNLMSQPEQMLETVKLPLTISHQIMRLACEIKAKSADFFVVNVENIDSTMQRVSKALMTDFEAEKQLGYANIELLVMNEVNDKIYDMTAAYYASHEQVNSMTCQFIKQFARLLNLEQILGVCQQFQLSECVTVCYIAMNQTDNAILSIVDADGNRDLLLKLLQVSESRGVHAKVFRFLLDKHWDDLPRFLELVERHLQPSELMQVAGMCENACEKMFDSYFRTRVLDAEEFIDDAEVNTKFIGYMTEKILVEDVRKTIEKVQNFNKGFTASKMEQFAEFKLIAALLYNQIEMGDKCIQILIGEKEIKEAIVQVQITKQRPAAHRLLDYACANSDENLIDILKAVESIMRLDDLLAVCWKHQKMNEAMPYVIMQVGRICEKLESE